MSDRGGQAPARRAKKGSRHRRAVGTPVPRHAIAHASAHNLCRAGSPEPDPFGIGRSRTTVSYRSVGPEETFFTGAIAGDGPPRDGPRKGSRHRRARACPSPCLGRGNSRGWRAVFAQSERSRGTGPRATGKKRYFTVGRGPSHATRASERVSLASVRAPGPVGQDRLILTRLCSGEHKLQREQKNVSCSLRS